MTVTAAIAPVDDGVIRVTLNGTLSPASAIELRRVLLKCLAEQPVAVIVDVAALNVHDPVQLTVFPAAVAAHSPRVALVLVNAAPVLRAMMDNWILRSVAVCDTAEQAVSLVVDHAADKIRCVDLPAGSTAAAQARAVAARFCEENALWEAMDSVVLVTSELVSNAVRHAHSAPRIRLAIRGPYLYVSVQDHSTRLPVLSDVDHLNVSPLPPTGRGLHMVDVHSSAWGSMPLHHDKTVWAAIRVVPAMSAPFSE